MGRECSGDQWYVWEGEGAGDQCEGEGAGDQFGGDGEWQSFSGKEVVGSYGDDASWLEKAEVKWTSPEFNRMLASFCLPWLSC